MLPFKPTAAQKRALGQIAADMQSPAPMNRLLQGDVGSGKTLVAAEAAIIALENGCQVAMLAPTEILATQHYFYLRSLFSRLDYNVALLTGSATPARENAVQAGAGRGPRQQSRGGTHALPRERTSSFRKLGLAIVDEQHRFGVMQRLKFIRKGAHPDVLVMTAHAHPAHSPPSRSTATSTFPVIDELPPGRKPILTQHMTEDPISSRSGVS